jgi:hypothetical protein
MIPAKYRTVPLLLLSSIAIAITTVGCTAKTDTAGTTPAGNTAPVASQGLPPTVPPEAQALAEKQRQQAMAQGAARAAEMAQQGQGKNK